MFDCKYINAMSELGLLIPTNLEGRTMETYLLSNDDTHVFKRFKTPPNSKLINHIKKFAELASQFPNILFPITLVFLGTNLIGYYARKARGVSVLHLPRTITFTKLLKPLPIIKNEIVLLSKQDVKACDIVGKDLFWDGTNNSYQLVDPNDFEFYGTVSEDECLYDFYKAFWDYIFGLDLSKELSEAQRDIFHNYWQVCFHHSIENEGVVGPLWDLISQLENEHETRIETLAELDAVLKL